MQKTNNLDVHFSSKSQTWNTPRSLFDPLNDIWKFELDCACLEESALCDSFFTPETDGLNSDWGKHICWLNPPYDDIKSWAKKAAEAFRGGATVMMLIPSRTDTAAFHNYVKDTATYVCFLKGRLKFANPTVAHQTTSAPFPSCLVVYDNNMTEEKLHHLQSLGLVVKQV